LINTYPVFDKYIPHITTFRLVVMMQVHELPVTATAFSISFIQFSEINILFDSKEVLVESAKNWAKKYGFFLSLKLSGKEKAILVCIRGSTYSQKRNPSRTIKCNCEFKINARKLACGKWKPSLTNQLHNHRPISGISVPHGRALCEEQKLEVIRLSESLVAPRQIISSLQLNGKVISRDIYNIKAASIREKLSGRTPLQCLLDSLQQNNCFFKSATGSENNLTHLFFAFEEQIEMFRNYSQVILADCTYKTNRYKLPLLHFIGLSAVGKSFSVGFCFLKSETRADYSWALNAFHECFDTYPKVLVTDNEDALISASSQVFPHTSNLLCIWHLNKNVVTNCKDCFPTAQEFDTFLEDWNDVIRSNTELQFDEAWNQMRHKFSEFQRPILYLQNNLIPLKEKFATPWTNLIRHLGTVTTSRAEGLHAQIKRYLVSSREDILSVYNAIKLAVNSQITEIACAVEQQKIVNYSRFGGILSKVRNKISVYALDLLLRQNSLQRPLNDCTGSFSRVYGIPCAHRMDERMHEKLEMEDFCEQWRLFPESPCIDNNQFSAQITRLQNLVEIGGENVARALALKLEEVGENSQLNNPLVLSSIRGRPTGALNRTRRDPSAFEYVEGTTGLKRCSKCGVLGHNARTCTSETDQTLSQSAEGSSRRCGVCGLVGSGHNARTCPSRRQ
jgi:hypothetical protein